MGSLEESGRVLVEDKKFITDITDHDFRMHRLVRISAKKKTFSRVSFHYTIFENCYFRDCAFIDCHFVGVQFSHTNLRGSTFEGCHFDYCRFVATQVGTALLERHMPGHENIALDLARALRVNYAQLGNTDGVNLAIKKELEYTRTHLKKATWSSESYYRKKYNGLGRFRIAVAYYAFLGLEVLWGNGESFWKVLRAVGCTLLGLFALSVMDGNAPRVALQAAPAMFFGTAIPGIHGPLVPLVAAISRFVMLGLFMSVLVRRLARR